MVATDDRDHVFARRLLDMARADFERAHRQPVDGTRRAVALWMCDEMLREAASLSIPDTLAGDLRQTAREMKSTMLSHRPSRRVKVSEAG